jgi:DNA invertase Pin-like site-specific DNA recombinase
VPSPLARRRPAAVPALLALRKYADTNGYEIADEISEEISGRKQDTEGLERIRDLADSGKIDAVLVYKWNRLARTVARFESFMLEMKLTGVNVMSLDGQSNETASGRMFNRLMAVFSEYQRDDLVETMQQGKRGVARAGKVVPSRFAPYGFRYDRDSRSYVIDNSRMESVSRLFRMVGIEGKALWAVKRVFDVEAVPTTRGGRYLHVTTLRDMILNDAYRPHTNEDLAVLVDAGNLSPDVLSTLDPKSSYGIAWYNRHQVETIPGDRQIKTPRPRSEWIAMPVPDSGVPREWVDAAREAIKDNVRPSDAGRRYWNLKGFSHCPCGARLTPHTVTKKGARASTTSATGTGAAGTPARMPATTAPTGKPDWRSAWPISSYDSSTTPRSCASESESRPPARRRPCATRASK